MRCASYDEYFEISFLAFKNVIILSLCTQRCYGRHNVSRKSIKYKWFIDLLHGIISLPDATSYDKKRYLTLYLIETPLNDFANGANTDKAALVPT